MTATNGMTTWERILDDLRVAKRTYNSGWVCGSHWYANFTPTFSQRISRDLKPRGYVIESRRCQRIEHSHRGTIHEYRLVSEP